MISNKNLPLLLIGLITALSAFGAENVLSLAFAEGDRVENNVAAIRVLDEAYQKLGVQINIVELPGGRALRLSNRGELDGELHRVDGINIEYPNLIQIPVSISKVSQHAFAKKDIKITNWESLGAYSLAITIGYILAEKNTEGMQRQLVSKWEQGFLMVESGHADITIANRYRGLKILNDLGIQDVRLLNPPLEMTPLYHYLHLKHVHLVPKITSVLRKMKANGRIDEILSQVETEFDKKRDNKH